jgi:signal transduction histidine kinase
VISRRAAGIEVGRHKKAPRAAGIALSTYLVALVAIFIVTAGGGAIFVLTQATSDAEALSGRVATYAAQRAAADLGASTTQLQATVANIASVPSIGLVAEHPSQCHLTFASANLFTVGRYDIVRGDGSVACSSNSALATLGAAGYGGTSWLAQALAGPILITPSLDPSTGLLSVLSAAPITSGGAVVAFVDLNPVGAEISKRYGGVGNLDFIVTTPGGRKVVARSHDPARWIGASLAETPFVGTASAGRRADLEGSQRLYGAATVAGTGWQVYAGATLDDTLAAAYQLFRQELAILLVGLAIVALGTFFVYRKVTRPIARLSSAVRAATARSDLPPLAVDGPSEVRTLAADFNALIHSVGHELGERRRAEVEVQLLNSGLEVRVADRTELLETANRDLEAFSYSVAHDLRAPLTIINGFTEILISEHAAELSAGGADHLRRVRDAAGRMSGLISDMLAFAHLSRADIHRGPVLLRPIVDRVVAALQAAAPDRAMTVKIGALPVCEGDEALLDQVLVNLLGNAWKFTAGGKTPSVEIGSETASGATVYFVRDNGVGFDGAYAEKIFEVFHRAHPSDDFPGTGVGLAIVKRIVARHGGRVWAESEPGKGATFRFTLGDRAA